MADKDREAARALALFAALEKEPYKHGFYRTLREIECIYSDRSGLGRSARPADDPVRLGQEPELAFANATLAALVRSKHKRPPLLLQRFLGLFGPNGPLPIHLTEYARERLRQQHDLTLARFADIFHHRMLSLFYRAWANTEPTVHLDRHEDDRFQSYVGSLCGIGIPELRKRDLMPDHGKLFFSGRLACQARNPEGLEALLTDFFEVKASIVEFVGHWLQLPQNERWRLGLDRRTGTLGVNAIVGQTVWDRQHKFRIQLGPMDFTEYLRFLPGEVSMNKVVAVVRNYVGDELDWEVNLILEDNEVPPFKLGSQGLLGWTTWLGDRRTALDANDLCVDAVARIPTSSV